MFVSAGVNLLGGLLGGGGMKGAADNTQAIAEYNARLDERNAKALRQAAEVRLWQGDVAEVEFMDDFGEFVSDQHAFYGAAGVQQSTGSALEVALASAEEASEEMTLMNYNVALDANQIREQAIERDMAAAVTRAEGAAQSNAMRSRARSQMFGSIGSSLMLLA